MGWFTRIDRFGDSHLCFSQEQAMSCGLASAKMVVFKVNKFRPGAASLTTENWVETIYKKYDATAKNVGQEGVFDSSLAQALNELNIGTWKYEKPPKQDIAKLLVDKMGTTSMPGYVAGVLPIILGIDWGGMGGHVVVLDAIHTVPFMDGYFGAVCDPGDGNVHITRFNEGEVIQYEGRRADFGINFWGAPENNYKQGKTIQGTIEDVIYCETPP